MLCALPIRDFDGGMTRLGPLADRPELARRCAERVARACLEAGLEPVIVTGVAAVEAWADGLGIPTLPDPGSGLDGAAARAVAEATGPWLMLHADLPLISGGDIAALADALESAEIVLVPSPDGGTNAIGATGDFSFRFGPGSFARHVAAAAGKSFAVLTRPGLMIELDTAGDLAAAARLTEGAWLAPFLT